MKIFILLFIAAVSINTWAQKESCSQPLDTNFPQVTVIAPDLSLLTNAGEKIRYFYTVTVDGSLSQYVITNSITKKNNKTSVKILDLGETLHENGDNYVDMTVNLNVEFTPVGTTWKNQIFKATQHYKVKTAELCLDEKPFDLLPVKIKLPPIGTFDQYFRLDLVTWKADHTREFFELDAKKVIDVSTNELNLRLINPSASGNKLTLFAFTNERTVIKAEVLLENSPQGLLEIKLTEDNFVPEK
ncbi:MAG: hypothetical protein H7235_10855 [Bdellovibrionaceae bacterium]|nr:hypothetical protein [Pseudobdellovibrionaceae bacterium]